MKLSRLCTLPAMLILETIIPLFQVLAEDWSGYDSCVSQTFEGRCEDRVETCKGIHEALDRIHPLSAHGVGLDYTFLLKDAATGTRSAIIFFGTKNTSDVWQKTARGEWRAEGLFIPQLDEAYLAGKNLSDLWTWWNYPNRTAMTGTKGVFTVSPRGTMSLTLNGKTMNIERKRCGGELAYTVDQVLDSYAFKGSVSGTIRSGERTLQVSASPTDGGMFEGIAASDVPTEGDFYE